MQKDILVSTDELIKQKEYCQKVKEYYQKNFDHTPTAFVNIFGCQQNVSDGEHIKGMLVEMGFQLIDTPDDADAVVLITCAVREHAEDRVFGNVGALKKLKATKKSSIIAMCGCMVQQEHIAEKLEKSYPYVDIIFGTHVLHRLPEFIYTKITRKKRLTVIPESDGIICEGVPAIRDFSYKGYLPIMYGCNNFCTYCIVPYVRGRERSREPQNIIDEAKQLIDSGCKDITLLGQNVNSYGKTLENPISFAKILNDVASLPGDFNVRFMTSHPKDCTEELLQTIADNPKISRHLHLPVQSGSDRILKLMNRHYDTKQYMSLIEKAKKLIPDVSLTSDIIVGFPGETYEDFTQTLNLIKEVRYSSLFTFIYSKRNGTPAAKMDDPISDQEKKKWFKELTDAQEIISGELCASYVGKNIRVLCEGTRPANKELLEGRSDSNTVVEFAGDSSNIGKFCTVKITSAKSWVMCGELVK